MLTKLTLTIEERIIKRAKKYAQNKNKSVSRIVEEYLDAVSDDKNNVIEKGISSPITDSLVGMFSDTGEDYKKMLEDVLMEKYI